MISESNAPWEVFSTRAKGERGKTFFFDVKQGDEGLRLVVTQTFPSGQRTRVTVAAQESAAFVSELLKAVSRMAGPGEPPAQHAPRGRQAANAYKPWSEDDDRTLLAERTSGHGIGHIARTLGREKSAISSRLRKLGDPLTASSSSRS